jgi:hypothetical protein
MDTSSNSGSPESRIDLATQYKIAFDAWKFQVDSYWQRNSYFAAFQGVALGAAWKILGDRSAVALCAAGIALVVVWYFNNLKVHSYIRYWWRRIGELERRGATEFALVEGYEHRRWGDLEHHPWERLIWRFPLTRYSSAINAIPLLFLFGWLWMLNVSIRAVNLETGNRSVLTPNVSIVPPITDRPSAPSSQPRTKVAGDQILGDSGTSEPPKPDEPTKQLEAYTELSIPNNLYGAGLAYGIDTQGNRYLLSDLVREAKLKTFPIAPPFTSYAVSIPQNEFEKVIDQNRWGDLVSRVLFVVEKAAQKSGEATGDVQLKVVDVAATKTDLTDAWSAIRETQFWRQRRDDFRGMRLFLVAETISSRRVSLTFAKAKSQVLTDAFRELSKLGPDTFLRRGDTSIDVISRLPLVLAYKGTELEIKNSAKNRAPAHVVPARFGPHTDLHRAVIAAAQNEKLGEPVLELLPSTHYTDAPPRLISLTGNPTYGSVLDELRRKILTAGINEVRIYDSGFGFAIATRFEVTEENGVPLPGEARFLPRWGQGKRLRGYYITVAAHPKPNAYVSTRRPRDLFSMKYGLTSLPDGMDQIPIEPGTTVRVFVLEFNDKSGDSRQLQNQECGSSAQDHMTQSGLVKQ